MSTHIRKNIAYTVIPVAALALAGILMKKMANHSDGVAEKVKELAKDAKIDIENTFDEFRGRIEGKTASQLEKNLDSALTSAKGHLDRVVMRLKSRLHEDENKRSNAA